MNQKGPACRQAGFASLLILVGIAIFILIGGVVVYQKVLAPKAQPTPIPKVSPSPILTSIITTTPSSTPQPSPTPVSVSNWLYYYNRKYQFTLNYPPDWRYTEVPNQSFPTQDDGVWFTPASEAPPKWGTDSREAVVIKISTESPLINWKGNYSSQPYKLGTLDGKRVSETIKNLGAGGYENIMIFVKLPSGKYLSTTPRSTSGWELASFDQILSTFKFLD